MRVSTSDKGQTVRYEGISGTKGRDKRPGLDALLKGVARREFEVQSAGRIEG
jgi:hypothetical protein